MNIVEPAFRILDANSILRVIESGGRVCYKSEDQIGPGSAEVLVDKLMNFKHESVLEHGVITVWFRTDRGVSHELVRHRLASFSQESTRYCNYGKGKFSNEITVVEPFFFGRDSHKYHLWQSACEGCESIYLEMVANGVSAQEARSVLPNSLKTEIQVTANVREWRKILELRTHRDAHPQMRQIMVPLGWSLAHRWPSLFKEYAATEHLQPAVELD